VLCAANNFDTIKVADQHMAEHLAAHGELLYVDPPLSLAAAFRNPALRRALRRPRLRMTPGGFWRLTPVVPPFPLRRGMRSLTRMLVRRELQRATAEIDDRVAAVISAWPTLDVFGVCGERLRVWWAQDDFAAGAELMGTARTYTAAGERARAAASDLVVAANPLVAEHWREQGCEVELIPYGCDVEAFASTVLTAPAAGVNLTPPVAAVVGQFNERTDPRLLAAVADAGISLLLVGPDAGGGWVGALSQRENVQWVGAQPFAALPAYLAHAQVGLVPYTDSAFNRASFPLKTLEYLAAGLPVVTTDLPATRWLNAGAELIRICDDPHAFAAAAVALSAADSLRARAQRQAFARLHSYECRALELLAAIDLRAGQ
jgi:teichuronic acid biosynthesis glycosyltransferase TuaH